METIKVEPSRLDSSPPISHDAFRFHDELLVVLDKALPAVEARMRGLDANAVARATLVGVFIARNHLNCANQLLRASECIPAAVLTRTAYEIAAHVLWACRISNGHKRLLRHWIREREKWAEDAAAAAPGTQQAEEIGNARVGLAAQADDVQPCPSMRLLLRELEDEEQLNRGIETTGTQHLFHYANVYRYFSSAVHGDPAVSLNQDRTWWLLQCGHAAHLAVKMLLLAVAEQIDGSQILDFDDFSARMGELWNWLQKLWIEFRKSKQTPAGCRHSWA